MNIAPQTGTSLQRQIEPKLRGGLVPARETRGVNSQLKPQTTQVSGYAPATQRAVRINRMPEAEALFAYNRQAEIRNSDHPPARQVDTYV